MQPTILLFNIDYAFIKKSIIKFKTIPKEKNKLIYPIHNINNLCYYSPPSKSPKGVGSDPSFTTSLESCLIFLFS